MRLIRFLLLLSIIASAGLVLPTGCAKSAQWCAKAPPIAPQRNPNADFRLEGQAPDMDIDADGEPLFGYTPLFGDTPMIGEMPRQQAGRSKRN